MLISNVTGDIQFMRKHSIDPEMFQPSKYDSVKFQDSEWDWFVDACREMEVDVSADKREKVEAIYSHLLGVNEWMNLTRLVSEREFLKFHLYDSLSVLDDVDEWTYAGDICVDLGSGGGYPGLPLATWLPDRKWVLVDSRQRKVSFLAEAIKLTGCKGGEAAAFRGKEAASACPKIAGRCALVTARAVGRTRKLMEEAYPILARGGTLLVLKGPAYNEEERDEVEMSCDKMGYENVMESVVTLEPDDPDRTVVTLRKVGR